jgi:TLD
LELLYRGSENGWHVEDFHENCDGVAKTLVLLLTDKDIICGGYISVGFGYQEDSSDYSDETGQFIKDD